MLVPICVDIVPPELVGGIAFGQSTHLVDDRGNGLVAALPIRYMVIGDGT